MEEVEIPQYFICPISLQIMKDPVTAVSGITYERESIEHWLKTAKDTMCPVTKQPLPRDSDLIPNHTLRRLIQAWCVANAKNGVHRIPTPKSLPTKSHLFKLIRCLNDSQLCANALKKLQEIAQDKRNQPSMGKAGATRAMVLFTTRCFKERKADGLEEALKILHLIWEPTEENKDLVKQNNDLIESIFWALRLDLNNHVALKTHAVIVLKLVFEVASSSLLERLKPDFFKEIVNLLRNNKMPQQATKAAISSLIAAGPWGGNRMKIAEAGAVFELIELELSKPEKKVTELVFCLLAQLCSCADGRQQFLIHAGSVAMVAKRILRVSPATDDRAVHIIGLISKVSATSEVVMEMLRVGAVSKLCMVLQADCAAYLKKKARDVLKMHFDVWNNSPCIAVYLLTKDPR